MHEKYIHIGKAYISVDDSGPMKCLGVCLTIRIETEVIGWSVVNSTYTNSTITFETQSLNIEKIIKVIGRKGLRQDANIEIQSPDSKITIRALVNEIEHSSDGIVKIEFISLGIIMEDEELLFEPEKEIEESKIIKKEKYKENPNYGSF